MCLREACFSLLLRLFSSSISLPWPAGQKRRAVRSQSWKWPKIWKRWRQHKCWSKWLSSASLFVLLLVGYCTILILSFPFSRCGIPPAGGDWSLKEFSMLTGIHFDRAGLTNYHLNGFHFYQLPCNNAFAKAFDQNKPLTVFLQRRGSYLHPQSKDEDIGVLIIYNLYIYQLCDKLFKTNSLKSSTLIFCCLATKFLKVKHQRSGVITIVFRWKVLILSASSQKPKGFQPAWGLASTSSPLTWPPSSITWNSR